MNGFNSIRPPDKTPKPLLAFSLDFFRGIIGGDRFENIYKCINSMITALNIEDINLLDYGCGTMSFSSQLKKDGLISSFIGVDVYVKPSSLKNSACYDNYIQITTDNFEDNLGKFQLCLLIDVLHHIPEEDHKKTLMALTKVSDYILIKDHFEFGFFSRCLLRLADWFGNYAYGVSVPKRYFNKKRWNNLIKSTGLTEEVMKINVKVHSGIFGIIIPPRHHFISVLKNNG
jgi:hypothetical protein